MKKIIYIAFLLCVGIINAQESVEQIAFDYFFENIVKDEFATQRLKLKFSGKTEPSTTGAFSTVECLDKNESTNLIDNGFKESISININEKNLINQLNIYCKKGKRRKFNLRIYRGLDIDDNKLILLKLNEKNKRTYYYYVKVDKNLEVISWCKTTALN